MGQELGMPGSRFFLPGGRPPRFCAFFSLRSCSFTRFWTLYFCFSVWRWDLAFFLTMVAGGFYDEA